jgi:hypothetical protein
MLKELSSPMHTPTSSMNINLSNPSINFGSSQNKPQHISSTSNHTPTASSSNIGSSSIHMNTLTINSEPNLPSTFNNNHINLPK